MESLSKNIVTIMQQLVKNDGLMKMLVHNEDNPFDTSLPKINTNKLIDPTNTCSKILPFPFDITAEVEDNSFIRVYYNDGGFDSSEVIADSRIHIDIIVAKSLWLINDGERSLIRPYEMMGRIIDMVGKRSLNCTIKLEFTGWGHLAVNQKFDAIRLYADYFSVET